MKADSWKDEVDVEGERQRSEKEEEKKKKTQLLKRFLPVTTHSS